MIVKMRNKKQRWDADIGSDNIGVHEGTWKITTTYVIYKTGEVFKTGCLVFNPCIYDELIAQAKEVEKIGGVLEQKVILINKIIRK